MHNIQFCLTAIRRLFPSLSLSPRPLSFSLSFILFLYLTMLFDWIRHRNRGELSGILGQIQTFLKVIFFNQRLLKDSHLDFVRTFVESISLSSLSYFFFLLVTYLFPPVPSSFVWRVIKLVTSDGGFNWFHLVCVASADERVAPRNFREREIYLKMIYYSRDFSIVIGLVARPQNTEQNITIVHTYII